MVRWSSGGGPKDTDEATPIINPVRMELAPHARLGRRINATAAILVLLVFHSALLVTGILNYDAPCFSYLPTMLIVYGGIGLLFVYLLFREWLYYARLSSLPTMTNLVLCVVFYLCLCVSGGFLTYFTYTTRDTCGQENQTLWRWCFAAVLFFGCVIALFALVPLVRIGARCLCAPLALCIISCVEVVGVDVDLGSTAFDGIGGGAGGAGGGRGCGPGAGGGIVGSGSGSRARRKAMATAGGTALVALICGPFYLLCAPLLFMLRPLATFLAWLLHPCGRCLGAILQALGIMVWDEELGYLSFANPFSNCRCGPFLSGCTQIVMAPGCIVPGRSVVAMFVNTAAMLWFFLYMGYELYSSWDITCPSRAVPAGTGTFADAPLDWLLAGAPSPIHWLLLLFVGAGVTYTVLHFIFDLFSAPSPPPRSAFEASVWRGRRQVTVVGVVLLLLALITWGSALTYYTLLGDQCATAVPALYRIALLLVLILVAALALLLLIGCCVCLDCCVSGRMRFVVLLSDKGKEQRAQQQPPQNVGFDPAASTRVPGVEAPGEVHSGGSGGGGNGVPNYGGTATQNSGGFYIGAVDDEGSRLCAGSGGAAGWAAAGPHAGSAV